MHKSFLKVGFIGQGWIGKNYANEFEKRGYQTVRYSLEEPYRDNKDNIQYCRIVFIAVPTPTTPAGFDVSIVRQALTLVSPGCIAVVKSTLLPGTTKQLQREFPDRVVLCSPEFLSRGTAEQDAAQPLQNIIGIPEDTEVYRAHAQEVLSILPDAPPTIVSSNTAELFKYVHNTSLFTKSVFMNLLYDMSQALSVRWEDIQTLIKNDPMLASRTDNVSHWHITPVHKGGRGIGGDCHIKDFESFSRLYADIVADPQGEVILDALKRKNISLLKASNKDLDLLEGVYGSTLPAAIPSYRYLPPMRVFEYVAIAVGFLVIGAGVISIAATIASIV